MVSQENIYLILNIFPKPVVVLGDIGVQGECVFSTTFENTGANDPSDKPVLMAPIPLFDEDGPSGVSLAGVLALPSASTELGL